MKIWDSVTFIACLLSALVIDSSILWACIFAAVALFGFCMDSYVEAVEKEVRRRQRNQERSK